MNPKVDAYLRETPEWREETKLLRSIILDCGLDEAIKWGKPCYAFEGRNVVIIQGFKTYGALLFCHGALLQDSHGVLEKPGENTQGARRLRFTNLRDLKAQAPIVKAYLQESIAAQKAGLKVEFQPSPKPIPAELQKALDATPALNTAFKALTPGRQRAYCLFISAAKQSKTREARVEKYRQRILNGKGPNDD